jgi:hypothetical protein
VREASKDSVLYPWEGKREGEDVYVAPEDWVS